MSHMTAYVARASLPCLLRRTASSFLFFTLLQKSRPNTPPRLISWQIVVRRVASGSLSVFFRVCFSIEAQRGTRPERLPEVSHPCNVRAKRHFDFRFPTCYALLQELGCRLVNIIATSSPRDTHLRSQTPVRSRCSSALLHQEIARARQSSR